MKEIPLTRGLVCIVDDEDYEYLSQFKWHANSDGYASRDMRHPLIPNKGTDLKMHRFLLGLEFGDPRKGDHWNLNKLDNRRSNLRIATHAQNQQNKGLTAQNRSGFKGVCWHKRSQKWRAQISINGKKKYIGDFKTVEDAYAAYCAAAKEAHGEFANVGESVPARQMGMQEAIECAF